VISRVQAASPNGGISSYSTFGAGTRADYRFTERFSATMDLTASPLGGSSTSETAELGGSFSPLSWDSQVRPFFDVRAVYMHMYDTFISPTDGTIRRASRSSPRDDTAAGWAR
jgi:hypothetical protein